MSVEQIIGEVFNTPEGALTDDMEIQAIESWDSMVHMMLITTLEDTFDIRFEGEEIISIATVGELKDLVAKKKG